MRNFLSLVLIMFMTIGLFMHEAEAKRFGGGRSFGMSRSSSSFARPAQNTGFAQSAAGLKQNGSMASKWLGPLAGLAMGGLLASMFMGHGFGTGIMTWLAIGAAFLLIRQLLRSRKQAAAPQSQYYDGNRAPFSRDTTNPFMAQNTFTSAATPTLQAHPVGFDENAFLREAKVTFNRLQAAFDQKNLADIREFATPEVVAEAQLQIQERGSEANQTDVVTLNAELLDVQNESQLIAGADMQMSIATVRFSGLIQENRNEPAASFNEIWHFKKDVANHWRVAGIQQS